MPESSNPAAVPAGVEITTLRGRQRVQNVYPPGDYSLNEVTSCNGDWQYADVDGPDESLWPHKARGFQTLKKEQTGVISDDWYMLQPGITSDGRLVYRGLLGLSKTQMAGLGAVDLYSAGTTAKEAAAFALEMAQKLGLPLAADSTHAREKNSKGAGEASYTFRHDTKAMDISGSAGKQRTETTASDYETQQGVLKLFLGRWTQQLQQSLDRANKESHFVTKRSAQCFAINDTDYRECLSTVSGNGRSKMGLTYQPEPNDRFGNHKLAWIEGSGKSHGNTARLIISVRRPEGPRSRDLPDVKVCLALPTSTDNLTGISPGILDLLNEQSDLSKSLQSEIDFALGAATHMISNETAEKYSGAKEAILGIATRDDRLVFMQEKQKEKFTAYLCATLAKDLLKDRFGEGNYPIPAVREWRLSGDSSSRTIRAADLDPMPKDLEMETIRTALASCRPPTEEVQSSSLEENQTIRREEGQTVGLETEGDEEAPPAYEPPDNDATRRHDDEVHGADTSNLSSQGRPRAKLRDNLCCTMS